MLQEDLYITLHDMPHSAALEARIRQKVAKLERFCPRMNSCHVVVAAPHHRQLHWRLLTLRLNVMFPHDEIVITRDNHEDVYVLLRDAFVAARREIEKARNQHRGGPSLPRTTRARVTMEAASE